VCLDCEALGEGRRESGTHVCQWSNWQRQHQAAAVARHRGKGGRLDTAVVVSPMRTSAACRQPAWIKCFALTIGSAVRGATALA